MAIRDQYDVAVIGGGFLSVAGRFLRLPGNSTVVFERGADLMQRASYVNQARVHNGYHYPQVNGLALSDKLFPLPKGLWAMHLRHLREILCRGTQVH